MSSRWALGSRPSEARSSHGRHAVRTAADARARGPSGNPTLAGHRAPPLHIEVGQDWRRCGADEGGCGVLLPLNQATCPRCGQTAREDLLPLNVRRLLPTHDAYDHAVAVLAGTWTGSGRTEIGSDAPRQIDARSSLIAPGPS